MAFYVYILSDEKNERFIVSFTHNLLKQIHEMKFMQSGLFAKERINKLVYYEVHNHFEEARRREREITSWDDDYMKTIISLQNSGFDDLYGRLFKSDNNVFEMRKYRAAG